MQNFNLENLNRKVLEWISDSLKISVAHLQFTRMKGATSSELFLIQNQQIKESIHPETLERNRFVLRLLNNKEWLNEEPDLALHEASALKLIENTKLPCPKFINYSEEKELGSSLVLMSYLEGNVNITPQNFQKWLFSLAETLTLIHQEKAPGFTWHFKSWVKEEQLKVPTWTSLPDIWKKTIEIFLSKKDAIIERDPDLVFIHRDFHPMNVLWQGDSITGIVDWINACVGPVGVDVGHCRTNLALMYGPEIANQFLNLYRIHTFNMILIGI